MQARLATTKLRSRSARRAGAHHAARPHHSAARSAARDAARHRQAGGPEDRALYECGCGRAFEAEVTASVACPGCGAGQAW